MADRSPIEWTDATWNPVRGCTRVSPSCQQPGAEQVEQPAPCPFCGRSESMVDPWFDDVATRWRVGCGRCGASSGTHKEKAGAIAAWNRRAALRPSQDVEAALKEASSHVDAWRNGLTIALKWATVEPPDINDRGYWEHEIRAFDCFVRALSATAGTGEPGQ